MVIVEITVTFVVPKYYNKSETSIYVYLYVPLLRIMRPHVSFDLNKTFC